MVPPQLTSRLGFINPGLTLMMIQQIPIFGGHNLILIMDIDS